MNISIGVERFSYVFSSAAGFLLLFYLQVSLVFYVEQVTIWHFQYLGSEVKESQGQ